MSRASGLFPGLKGRIGNVVVVPYGDDLILRERPTRVAERTPEQAGAIARQTRAAKLWKSLPAESAERWEAYAVRTPLPPREDGTPASRRPMNVYGSLAMRYQLVHGVVAPPTDPPTTAFLGDAIALEVATANRGLSLRADGPNAPGVVTQILIQPLASGNRRTYLGKYVHARIVAFTTTEPVAALDLDEGWVAAAYRFIKAGTGQTSALVELGKVRIG